MSGCRLVEQLRPEGAFLTTTCTRARRRRFVFADNRGCLEINIVFDAQMLLQLDDRRSNRF